jgi:hypothetical protein
MLRNKNQYLNSNFQKSYCVIMKLFKVHHLLYFSDQLKAQENFKKYF